MHAQLVSHLLGTSSGQGLEAAMLIDQADAAETPHEETPPPCTLEQTSILSGEAPDHRVTPTCEEAPIDWDALALSPPAETLRQRLADDHWRALVVPGYGGVRREQGWYNFFMQVENERTIASAVRVLTKRQAEEAREAASQQRRDERRHATRERTVNHAADHEG